MPSRCEPMVMLIRKGLDIPTIKRQARFIDDYNRIIHAILAQMLHVILIGTKHRIITINRHTRLVGQDNKLSRKGRLATAW